MFRNKELEKRNEQLISQVGGLTRKIQAMAEKIRQSKKIGIDYNVEEPSPSDATERESYVARSAGFYQDILEPKIRHMISVQQNELSNPTNPKQLDNIIKGTINALSLMMDWGTDMVNEHLANINKNKDGEN